MVERAFGGAVRKTCPMEVRRRSGPVGNGPDLPKVQVEKLPELSTFVPNGREIEQNNSVVTEPASRREGYGLVMGQVAIPQVRRPINPVFTVEFGGGRVYGGGTSEKSLRNARKKAAKKRNNR
ncbi:MAG: hypothetical protein ABH812_01185 [bacterium]